MAHVPSENELALVKVLYSALPAVSASFFFIATCIRAAADAVILTAWAAPGASSPTVNGKLFYSWASCLLWFVNLLWYIDSAAPTAYPFYGTWAMYLAAEVLFLLVTLRLQLPRTSSEVLIGTFRLSLLVTLILTASGSRFVLTGKGGRDEENTPLLIAQGEPRPIQGTYGSCENNSAAQSDVDASSKTNGRSDLSPEDDLVDDGDRKTLWDIVEFLRAFLPFFWPSGEPGRQLLYVGIGGCLVVERVMNVIIPLQLGLITNLLTKSDGVVPWKEIAIFIALRFLDSSGGLTALRSFMWMPLEDLSYRKISTTAFNHIMSLSCDFHDSKASGAVWQTIIRGQYVKDVVNHICFLVIPTMIDLVLAVSILYYLFDAYMALVTAAVTVMFLWTSNKIINIQKTKQRESIEKRTREFTLLCESTVNWKTVSYFNRVPHEQYRYHSAVGEHLKSRFGLRIWGCIENTLQSFVLLLGLMVACLIAAYQVSLGFKPIGSFVMMLSYWAQLSSPLQSLANGFEHTVQDMVDAEELLRLLRQKPTVADSLNAKPLSFERGCIEFKGVQFSYDGKREVLRNINFKASPGQTTAIVGKTGGGKSTILKLLCRFYDPAAGVVNIDGQDISSVTLQSLREILGIVPQDPILFCESIMANIRYAKLDATDEEIVDACKAVALHEKIMSFPDGYDTLVGERGMKLSGGELQRVAIARAMIKNPKVVLLDEATSSVDSETEAHVQKSLKLLCAGRTTIVIAHRLSTIMNADQILVVNDGEIVEKGSHSQLLRAKGYYHRLCSWQGFSHTDTLEDKAPQAVINDIGFVDTTVEDITCSQMQSGSTTARSPFEAAKIERPDIRSCSITSQIPQVSIGQDLCEHCCRCLNATSSTKTSKIMNHTSGNLKPEAPEFVPRAFQNYSSGFSHPYYIQVDANHNTLNSRYVDHPPSGYASDTGESVEIRTGPTKEKFPDTEVEAKPDTGIRPTLTSPDKRPNNDVKSIGASLKEPSKTKQADIFNGDEVLSAIENNKTKSIIRRKLSKSEPAGLINMNGTTENSSRGSEESQSSGHGVTANERPPAKLSENVSKHRRRRRRNNWRRRKEMRTNASTQSGTDGMRSSSE
ncbi:conserved hypothetical protein [Uncinocarpus reesii 1704]|uniref:Heavy metal tolerance protein n=1 Tax=Uncinocarpus reesii (strain UAMH 1704) TaxID=336963 RepID=C4JYV2_UNCRE|nr:uncharacterized protein UREG_07353 [Uncinocarpus reesii 1704]EEP82488.1 conserved hypothetical protein [Uncinocarpus reesii 1704]